jgi:predicted transposase/invertase (TIGR01784 family)
MNQENQSPEATPPKELSPEMLSPKSDYIFKLLFGEERSIGILTDFLQSVLRLPADEYESVHLIDPHLKREREDDKLGILDVRVRTKTRKEIDIEIQVEPYSKLRERVVYYSAKMLTGQIKSGKEYEQIRRVISIIITDFALIPDSEAYHHRFTLYDPETIIEFTDILEVHTLELEKLPAQEDGTELWNWMRFLTAQRKEEFEMLAERNSQIKQAVMILEELSHDERTRLLYDSHQKMVWDNLARASEARAEGKAEGRAEGEIAKAIAIAKKMLQRNRPVDEIIEDTGLTRGEVEGLREAE